MTIADAAKEFSNKRKEFLSAHATNYRSNEADRLYSQQSDAWDRLRYAIEYAVMEDPDGTVIQALEQIAETL